MVLTTAVRGGIPATVLAAVVAVLGAGCGGQSAAGEQKGTPGSAPGSATMSGSPTASGSATVDGSAPSSVTVTTAAPGPGGGTAADRVVFFSAAPKGPANGHQVLHDRAETERYAAAFATRDPQARTRIVAAGRATDFARQVLVGWTAPTGCSAATAAALTVTGDRLDLQVSQPEPPAECVAPFRVSVVFQVARERIPAQPVFG
jgi:hypothetical protein